MLLSILFLSLGIMANQLNARHPRTWYNQYKETKKSKKEYEHADKKARDLHKKFHSDIELKHLDGEKRKYHNLASDKAVYILQGNPETKDKGLDYTIWDYGVDHFDKKNEDGSIQGNDYIRKIYTDGKDNEGLKAYNEYVQLANDKKNEKIYYIHLMKNRGRFQNH